MRTHQGSSVAFSNQVKLQLQQLPSKAEQPTRKPEAHGAESVVALIAGAMRQIRGALL
jgi:hypothetical protein